MKKILILIPLLLAPVITWAEWVEVVTEDSIREVSVYIDSSAIRRKGDIFAFWTLWDFTTAQTDLPGAPYRSARSQQEINCVTRQSRVLTLSYHAEQMALGEVVFSYAPDGPSKELDRSWKPVAPNTFFSVIFKSLCEMEK